MSSSENCFTTIFKGTVRIGGEKLNQIWVSLRDSQLQLSAGPFASIELLRENSNVATSIPLQMNKEHPKAEIKFSMF